MSTSALLRLQSHLRRAQRDYAKAERALIKAALVGCMRNDQPGTDWREASSSGRVVDLSHETANLRYARNEITMIEAEIRRVSRQRARGGAR